MGADYRRQMTIPILWATLQTIAAGITRYFTYLQNANEATEMLVMPMSGTFMSLIAGSGGAAGAGETFTYTFRVNGASTALACTIAGAVATQGEDLVNTVHVVRGDEVNMRVITTGAAAVVVHRASMIFVPD